jgi:hypothetical protein
MALYPYKCRCPQNEIRKNTQYENTVMRVEKEITPKKGNEQPGLLQQM